MVGRKVSRQTWPAWPSSSMPQTVARSSASHAMKLLWSTEKNCYNFMYKDVKNRFMAISLEMCFVLVLVFVFFLLSKRNAFIAKKKKFHWTLYWLVFFFARYIQSIMFMVYVFDPFHQIHDSILILSSELLAFKVQSLGLSPYALCQTVTTWYCFNINPIDAVGSQDV